MLDFLLSNDWLNRGYPSYAFKIDHLLFILIALTIGIVLAFLLRKRSKKTIKIVLITLWAMVVIIEIVYYAMLYTLAVKDPANHPFNIEYMLPLHSCLMIVYVFPIAMFVKNKVIKTAANNFLVVVNMIMGFITLFVGCPPKGTSALSFGGFQSLFYHAVIVINPIIMLVTNYYDIKKEDIKYGLALFGILSMIIFTFDVSTGCDYFYFFDGHTFGILYVISENIPRQAWTLLIVTCYILTALIIHYSVILIKKLASKNKEKTA